MAERLKCLIRQESVIVKRKNANTSGCVWALPIEQSKKKESVDLRHFMCAESVYYVVSIVGYFVYCMQYHKENCSSCALSCPSVPILSGHVTFPQQDKSLQRDTRPAEQKKAGLWCSEFTSPNSVDVCTWRGTADSISVSFFCDRVWRWKIFLMPLEKSPTIPRPFIPDDAFKCKRPWSCPALPSNQGG